MLLNFDEVRLLRSLILDSAKFPFSFFSIIEKKQINVFKERNLTKKEREGEGEGEKERERNTKLTGLKTLGLIRNVKW